MRSTMSNNNDTFIKITNKEVYSELKQLRLEMHQKFNMIIENQKVTNGKVKLNRWMATTAISLALVIVGLVFR